MYQRIVVPLDGSILAEQVLAWVEILAKGLHSRVELLQVIEPVPEEVSDTARGLYTHQIEANLIDYAQDYLNGLATPLRSKGLSVLATARAGNPADCIASEGAGEPDTLIAMTTHGRSGIGRWLLGSVTDKVLHIAANPLLMVRAYGQESPAEDIKLKTLILPLDGSPLAEQVLPHAEALAKPLGLKALLARAVRSLGEYHQYMEHSPVSSAATVYTSMYEEFSRNADAQAMKYLHQVKEQLNIHHIPSVEETLLRGPAAASIVDLARQTPHSLVAMTTHGRSGVERWLLGSVTDRVVRHSGGPVLVVKAGDARAPKG